MKRSHLVTTFLLLSLFAINIHSTKKPKWKPIFNGNNLDGWTMKISGHEAGENYGNTFTVKDGIINVRYDDPVYANFNSQFGALYYKKRLTNYRLKVEYRFVGETAKGAPSWGFRDNGVNFHGQSAEAVALNQPFPVTLETNLLGGNGKDERPNGEICANGIIIQINGQPNPSFCNPPTVKRTFHGDQWVTLEIDVQGPKIVQYLNGEEILRFEDPRYNPKHDIAKTLIVDGNDKVTSGYVSLQSNSHPIDFRKIELMEY